MKTFERLFLILLAVVLMTSCTTKPVKTIENLKAGYNGESTASAKYAAFAEKAEAEGLDTIAVMFKATSKSEAIHAANHRNPEIGAFNVLSTSENLADAIKGESYEIETMYPEFIAAAESEKSAAAVKSFKWAFDTEKKHQAFYNVALASLNVGGEKNLAAKWFVCPVCGNTYDMGTVAASCAFCMTSKDKFIEF
jgi:rubrerythrin